MNSLIFCQDEDSCCNLLHQPDEEIAVGLELVEEKIEFILNNNIGTSFQLALR